MEMNDIEILKERVKNISEDDFYPVADDYGNMIILDAKDFRELDGEARGEDVVLIIRGAIKGKTQGVEYIGKNPEGEKSKKDRIEIYIWNAALVHGRKPKLGSGKRFEKLVKALRAKGAYNPKALAAWIGRKKFGAEKMAKLAAAGKRRKKRK